MVYPNNLSKKFRLTIAYDGTRFSGWQVQPRSPSIQGTIENALSTLLRAPHRIIGSGRTDAGVHARGQVAHFTTDCACNPKQILHSLNGMLPDDIRILNMEPAQDTFHAQISALSKEYHYHLWFEKIVDPFVSRYRYHFCYDRFSLKSLEEATQDFVGTHNFATFANIGSHVGSTIRTIKRLTLVPQEGGVRLEFEGDGFLYKMVRNIMGTLLEISIGKRTKEEIQTLFAAQDRRAAGPAAPPKGLFLMCVNYSHSSNISINEWKCEKERGIPSEIF